MRRLAPSVSTGPLLVSLLASLLAACGAERPAPSGSPVAPATTLVYPTAAAAKTPPPPREDGRLPVTATPERYAIALTIDPTQPRFSGTATIMVAVPQPTSFLVMHARGMRIARASVTQGVTSADASTETRAAHGSLHEDELVLRLPQPLAMG